MQDREENYEREIILNKYVERCMKVASWDHNIEITTFSFGKTTSVPFMIFSRKKTRNSPAIILSRREDIWM